MSNIENTLSIIKPDAVERNLDNQIKEIFIKNGFSIIKEKFSFLQICLFCHCSIKSWICDNPSVRAAGPGCKIIGDFISNNEFVLTALIELQPCLIFILSKFTFLPHQEAKIISGFFFITSWEDTALLIAFCDLLFFAKISTPPEISIISETQRVAEIYGSSHSSKYILGFILKVFFLIVFI